MTLTEKIFPILSIALVILSLAVGEFRFSGLDNFGDSDGYWHAFLAEELRDVGPPSNIPWLPETILADSFADQHLLYHAALIPFLGKDPETGVKLSIVFFDLLLISAFFVGLRRNKVGNISAGLFIFAFVFGSTYFFARLLLAKGTTLFLAILFLFLCILEKERSRALLFLLPCILTLTYGGFVFLPFILLFFLISGIISGKLPKIRSILLPLFGIAVGILIHPAGPFRLLLFLYHQIFFAGPISPAENGGEWTAASPLFILISSGISAALSVFAIAILGMNWKKVLKDRVALFLFFCMVFFFFCMLRSVRFVEYWHPFAILFTAVVFQKFLPIDLAGPRHKIARIFEKYRLSYFLRPVSVLVLFSVSIFIGILILGTAGNIFSVIRGENAQRTERSLSGAASFLQQHSEKGEVVFHADWHEFYEMLFRDRDNTYVVGLAPAFLYLKSPEHYWMWEHIVRGEKYTCGTEFCDSGEKFLPADAVRTVFHARYILLVRSDMAHLKEFEARLSSDSSLKKVYEDGYAAIYELQ